MVKQQYVQLFKRRRVGKTDYRKRRAAIQGRKPFLTVRLSNKFVYGQIVRPAASGDITLCSSSSRMLSKKFGWKGAAKNLPSSYLTGYLLGKQARLKKINDATVYIGVARFVHGSRLASFLVGAKDAGLDLEFNKEVLPDEARIRGNHIANFARKLSSEGSNNYRGFFSRIRNKGLNPEDYPRHFDEMRALIENDNVSKEKPS